MVEDRRDPKRKNRLDRIIVRAWKRFEKKYNSEYEKFFEYCVLRKSPFGHLLIGESDEESIVRNGILIFPFPNEETIRLWLFHFIIDEIEEEGLLDKITVHGDIKSEMKYWEKKITRWKPIRQALFPDLDLLYCREKTPDDLKFLRTAIEIKYGCWKKGIKDDFQKLHYLVGDEKIVSGWFLAVDENGCWKDYKHHGSWAHVNKMGWRFFHPVGSEDYLYIRELLELEFENRLRSFILYDIARNKCPDFFANIPIVKNEKKYDYLHLHLQIDVSEWANPSYIIIEERNEKIFFLLYFYSNKLRSKRQQEFTRKGFEKWFFLTGIQEKYSKLTEVIIKLWFCIR